MLWKWCTQFASKCETLSSGRRTGKGQFSSQSQRKAIPKNAQTTAQLHSSHMLEMLKILQAGLQQNMNHELPAIQAHFRKGYIFSWRMGLLNLDFNSEQFTMKGYEIRLNFIFRGYIDKYSSVLNEIFLAGFSFPTLRVPLTLNLIGHSVTRRLRNLPRVRTCKVWKVDSEPCWYFLSPSSQILLNAGCSSKLKFSLTGIVPLIDKHFWVLTWVQNDFH